MTRMPLTAELNFHLVASWKRRNPGPSLTLLAGDQDGFHTRRSSSSPVVDVRAAKMSCTSHSALLPR
jgi:hypothetical protein